MNDASVAPPSGSSRRKTVGDLMRPAATTVELHAHLAAAAYIMRRAGDSALVVVSDDELRTPIAIITEEDITQAVADGRDVNEVRINQMVGGEPLTAQLGTTVDEAASMMLSAGIGHLPVVDDGHLVGIVDITDACRALLDIAALDRQ
jgi:CBS domain-containing protein